VEVRTVAGDITSAEGRAAALAAAPQIDILVNNAGGPPPGDFRDWDREAWIKAIDANMLTPIELMKATIDAMAARGYGRVVNITSGAVKAPIDTLGLSNGARSGLTGRRGACAPAAPGGRNVTINNLLPGPFDTDRLRKTTQAAASGMVGRPNRWDQRRLAVPRSLRHAGGIRRRTFPLQRARRLSPAELAARRAAGNVLERQPGVCRKACSSGVLSRPSTVLDTGTGRSGG
jgi:3-oxoacyl-[acyl-carrier protein] reductase